MDKAEHGKRLREAMASRGMSRTTLADALGKNVKTVTNWRSGTTLPNAEDRAGLREVLGLYDSVGDPVEIALRSTDLDEWRQDAVISFYKRQRHEQRAEEAS